MRKLSVLAFIIALTVVRLGADTTTSGTSIEGTAPAGLPANVNLSSFYGTALGFYADDPSSGSNGFYSGSHSSGVTLSTDTSTGAVIGEGSAYVAWTIVSGTPVTLELSSSNGALKADGVEKGIQWTVEFTDSAADTSTELFADGDYSGKTVYVHGPTSDTGGETSGRDDFLLMSHGSGFISITTDDAGQSVPATYRTDLTLTIIS